MKPENSKKIKMFPYIFFLATDGLSYFIIIPLVVFHIWLNLNFSSFQLNIFLASTAAAIIATMFPVVIISVIILKPIIKYFNSYISGTETDPATYEKAFINFINLPLYHGMRAFFCYSAGFAIIVIPVKIAGNINPVQFINLIIISLLIPVFSSMIYFSVTEILVQKYVLLDCFPEWFAEKTKYRISISQRIAGLSIVSAILPFMLLVSFFLKITMPLEGDKSMLYLMASLIGAIGIFISLFMSFLLMKSIIIKTTIIHDSIQKIREGDLFSRLYKISTDDEFQKINLAIAKVRLNLFNIVRAINDTIEKLTQSSVDLTGASEHFAETAQSQASSTEQMNATIEELSAGMESITDNTSVQNRNMNSLIDRMKEFSGTMEATAASTNNSIKLTDNMRESATAGEESLKKMIENINSIRLSSDRMNSIVEIISDISDRINLLSLNAAIESARAGEAGRGFAVVAEQISKLADQTAGSIKEIESLIRLNNDESRKSITNVDFTKSRIDIIADGVNTIVTTMNEIALKMQLQLSENQAVFDSANRINEMTEAISASTSEHKKAMDEIVRTITAINDGTQTISSGAEDVSGKTHIINDIIDSLKKSISFFRT